MENKPRSFTQQLLRKARRLVMEPRKVVAPGQERGFVCAHLTDLWCGGWYEGYIDAVRLTSGVTETRARRVDGMPARFAALFLLCKLVRARTPGMVCRPAV